MINPLGIKLTGVMDSNFFNISKPVKTQSNSLDYLVDSIKHTLSDSKIFFGCPTSDNLLLDYVASKVYQDIIHNDDSSKHSLLKTLKPFYLNGNYFNRTFFPVYVVMGKLVEYSKERYSKNLNN